MSSLLITGASGQLGRLVVQILRENKASPIIAVTRTPQSLNHVAAKGVDVRYADFDQSAGLATAFAGAHRMLLISTNSYAAPGHRARQHRAAIEAAVLAGVRHIVYTSFLNVSESPLAFLAADHKATEETLEQSGIGYTILRNSFYADMVLAPLTAAALSGSLHSAAGAGRIAYVTREDCALAAAMALAAEFEGNRMLDITGPAAINGEELVEIASRVLGADIQVVGLSAEERQEQLISSGTPVPLAKLLAAIENGVAQGALDIHSDAFQQLTGRTASSIAQFIASHRKELLGSA
jgi:NAD(P)H dehydrogenase (quinone)